MVALTVITALAQLQVTVPARPAPAIDGLVASQEWTGSTPLVRSDTSVRVMRTGDVVHLLVESQQPGIIHICVARGDTVDVLHASASLGSATYVKQGSEFRLVTPFAWAVRDANGSPAAAAERSAYLATHGWTGSTVAQSNTHHELQMSAKMLAGNARVAVARYNFLQSSVTSWPQHSAAGCGNTALVMGNPPDVVAFSPEAWLQLITHQ